MIEGQGVPPGSYVIPKQNPRSGFPLCFVLEICEDMRKDERVALVGYTSGGFD